MRRFALNILLLASTTAAAAGQEIQPLWLVVTKPMFLDALAPLVAQREKQFHTRVSTDPVAEAVAACPRPPDYILLVGDDEPGREDQPWHLPARRFRQYSWHVGKTPTFASDSAYGDTDGDHIPDIPVGRIPARTTGQLSAAIDKIVAWERRDAGLHDMQAALWTCDPAFGPLSRLFATPLALAQIDTRSPAWLQPSVLAGDAASAFCGVPAEQPAAFARKLAEGPALAVIMAHGSIDAIYVMQSGGQVIHFLPRHAARAAGAPPSPPLLAIACHTANFAGATLSFAEKLLFMPTGPVAVVGATAESHPLPNFYTGQAVLDALADRPRRLGDLWTAAARAAATKRSFFYELLLRQMEADHGMETDPRKLQRDHPLLYALLGDPATLLPIPLPLEASLTAVDDGWRWRIDAAVRPAGATKLLVQHRPLPSLSTPAGPPATPENAREALRAANDAYAFRTLDALDAEADWSGTIDRPGTLRLVAVGPDGLHATAFRLAPKNAQAAPVKR